MSDKFDYSNVVVPDEPHVAFEKISPEIAKEMLSLNQCNRKLNDKTVAELARAMEAGDYVDNGEGIKFSVDVEILGTGVKVPLLLDGQHRLHAIVKSGCTVRMLVIRELHPKSQATMDIGRKRTAADWLAINDVKEATALGAILSALWKLNRGDRMLSTNPKPTPTECWDLLDTHPEILRSLEVGVQTYRGFRHLKKTSFAVAHYMISQVDKEHAPYFFRLIATGSNLQDGHPVLAMRERAAIMKSQRSNPMPLRRELNLISRAWNYCAQNKMVNVIAAPDLALGVIGFDRPDTPCLPLLENASTKSQD
jgi:hypothetical protein